MSSLVKEERRFDRHIGSSPSENRFYTLIMFDISERKKYSLLTKLLKRYGYRIQNSIYEAYLRPSDIKALTDKVEKLMSSERYYNSADKVRIYRMAGSCSASMFGECEVNEEGLCPNIFI